MLNKLFRLFIKGIIILLFYGCEPMDISKYNGDGEIITTGRNFLSKGYLIKFDDFDLRKPFLKRYKIINYPKINKTFWCGLKVVAKDDDIEYLSSGSLSLKITAVRLTFPQTL